MNERILSAIIITGSVLIGQVTAGAGKDNGCGDRKDCVYLSPDHTCLIEKSGNATGAGCLNIKASVKESGPTFSSSSLGPISLSLDQDGTMRDGSGKILIDADGHMLCKPEEFAAIMRKVGEWIAKNNHK